MKPVMLAQLMLLSVLPLTAAENPFPLNARRIVFLGDSNMHAGGFVNLIELQLRQQSVDPMPELINLGLPSETCSGLSEPDHPFPRPDVHERLERVLEMAKPDVVVACYGMNDGIYYPFSEERFEKYQDGINQLIDKVHAAGAKLVLMTPPPFDAHPLQGTDKLRPAGAEKYAWFAAFDNYDQVIRKYAVWLTEQKDRVEMVIDTHTPVTALVEKQRAKTPDFTIAPDGVHFNQAGHQLMAEIMLRAWGIESWMPVSDAMGAAMTQKGAMLHNAWLSHVGHQRPGMETGLPLNQALEKAGDIDTQLQPLIEAAKKPVAARRSSSKGTVYQVHYASVAQPGALRLSVDYYLWIPSGVDQLRGIIVHQHGCGEGACRGGQTAADDLHWQALAAKWNCALMGSMYEPRDGINCRLWCDPREGSEQRFLQALDHFARASNYSELTQIPWCLWGHSGGAFWASLMQVKHPDRIVAIWLRSGTAFSYWTKGEIEAPEIPDAAYQVPVMANPGLKEKDDARFHVAWDGAVAMREAYLSRGAPFFEFAPDPRTGHECGDSRYLAIPFFDFWLQYRLPQSFDAGPSLQPAAAALESWKQAMSPMLQQYTETGSVQDSTPPEAPQDIHASRADDGAVTVVWTATADFESGIRGFIVERDGQEIARVPEKPVGRFGRPLFQTMSYHDTPELPLPMMTFTDKNAPPGTLPRYSVRTVNSVELASEPALAK